ncbi:hemerythrin domain-containing protein [Flexivirga meconopsidis]|uniref:hemerythrin domain-containing protein n=1 Tax=Flexivirga meconopsidis TaxID=2977121 RepID=UPI00223FA7DD|nr:hemerythrin domain-containing protein [Flexivirga meconopsidis]
MSQLRIGSYLPGQTTSPENTAIRAARADERGYFDIQAVHDDPHGPDPWVAAMQMLAVTANSAVLVDDVVLTDPESAQVRGWVRAAATAAAYGAGRLQVGLRPAPGTAPDDAARWALDVRDAVHAHWIREPATGFLERAVPAAVDVDFSAVGDDEAGLAAGVALGAWGTSTRDRDAASIASSVAGLVQRARAVGVDPATVRRRLGVVGVFSSRSEGFLHGPPRQWVAELLSLVREFDFDTVVVDPAASDRYSAMPFIAQVAPALRAATGWSRRAAVAPPVIERVGSWGDAGGLPVAERPGAPAIAPQRFVPMGEQNARWLRSLHEHLREALADIRAAVAAVIAGSAAPESARASVNDAARVVGRGDLAHECVLFSRELEGHHGSEDTHMFPMLRAVEPAVAPVTERLAAEHHVIAEALEHLDRLLVRLMHDESDDAVLGEIAEFAAVFEQQLNSHLAYEEDQLSDAMRLVEQVL